MLKLRLLIFSIIFIFPSDCRQQSIILRKPSLCINDTYNIPLFGTKFIRITLNRTRLDQLDVHTVRLRASIADTKVLQFEDRRRTIRKVFDLMNDTHRK
jgi:hypothetical protein